MVELLLAKEEVAGSSPVSRSKKAKKRYPYGYLFFALRAPPGLEVRGLRCRCGRRRADIPRMSCAPSSAWLRLLRGRRPWFKVSPPARSARSMRSPGPHSVSAPLRSLQNRRPPDVLQPIFRMASVVMGQAGYTYSVQDCILDQKERSIL